MPFSWSGVLAVLGGTIGFGVAGLGLDMKTSIMTPYVLMPALVAYFFGSQINNYAALYPGTIGAWVGISASSVIAGFMAAGLVWYSNGMVDLKMGVSGLACALGYTVGELIDRPSS